MLSGIDYFVVIVYMAGIMLLGLYFKRFIHSSQDYFLAGRMMPFWAIGMSIVVSDIGVSDDSYVPGLSRLTEAVHAVGGKISLQLAHGGRYCRSQVLGAQAVAPSAVPSRMTGETPRELTTEA